MSRTGPAKRSSLSDACARLLSMYDVDGWWPARSRFEVMVGAVLVQNTRWSNVTAAIGALRRARCLRPESISTLKPADLADLISSAGCQSVKARRLQAMAAWIERAGGLRRLATLDTDKLRAELLGVHGIGHETADAMLCFAFGRPCFVADRYARHWLGRMGVAPPLELHEYESCRAFVERGLQQHVSIGLADLHAAIVLHAKAVCTRNPSCGECGLQTNCEFARRRRA